jgi:hypothetical protein
MTAKAGFDELERVRADAALGGAIGQAPPRV